MSMRTLTQDELAAEAHARFGADPKAFAFVCPGCGDVATIREFDDAGDGQRAGQECIGRLLGAIRKDTKYVGRGCDWAAYGLISGPWSIVIPGAPARGHPTGPTPDTHIAYSFALATAPAASPSKPVSDLHPTKTRLALLADVDQPGEPLVYGEAGHAWWRMGTKVTARMDELERAGWVEVHIGLANRQNGVGGRWYFRATEKGQKILDTTQGLTWGVYDHGSLIETAHARYLAEMIRHDAADAADRVVTDYTIRLVDSDA